MIKRGLDPTRCSALTTPVAAIHAEDIAWENFGRSLPCHAFRELHAYWRSKCRGGRLPGRADIDPLDFWSLLPGIFLVDVAREADPDFLRFRFRLAGTAHLEINQIEITGMTIEEAFSPARVAPIRTAYTQVVRTHRPLLTAGLRAAIDGRCHVLFDRLLLPLASDGANVDMLLGHLRHERIAG